MDKDIKANQYQKDSHYMQKKIGTSIPTLHHLQKLTQNVSQIEVK